MANLGVVWHSWILAWKKGLQVALVLAVLCGLCTDGFGFYYIDQRHYAVISDVWLGKTGLETTGSYIEIRPGVWWRLPFLHELEFKESSWIWPDFETCLAEALYWDGLYDSVEYTAPKRDDVNILRQAASELELAYAYHGFDWSDNPFRYPAKLEWRLYSKEEGWRLGGLTEYTSDTVSISILYTEGAIWSNDAWRDTLAHELHHAQGQPIVAKLIAYLGWIDAHPGASVSDVPEEVVFTWADYFALVYWTDESLNQSATADVLAFLEERPEWRKAYYGFMRSLALGTACYMAYYGDDYMQIPISLSDRDYMIAKLRSAADEREQGKEPPWPLDYNPLGCYSCGAAKDWIPPTDRIVLAINNWIEAKRITYMQQRYLEVREMIYASEPPNRRASADARFKKWRTIPYEHAEALLEYDVLPYMFLTNMQDENITWVLWIDVGWFVVPFEFYRPAHSLAVDWQKMKMAIGQTSPTILDWFRIIFTTKVQVPCRRCRKL